MSGDPVRAALEAAIDAYDAARCKAHGQDVRMSGMSQRNRESITPMIAAAIDGFLRALPVGSGKGLFEFGDDDSVQCLSLTEAAAAVTNAAQEGGGDGQ